ncbi:restriction endonuclease [Ramlibacter sp. AW1]|uniref:Restriction endonuclease n=1 Tax=Ramlibacter aurantiacus TaxID=2801330 RepID=A0A936ZTR4_9BURK|nr:DNA methyltransferase [Ramlibacter aurantiacus]MBL0422396.1 restriction endonuclease [Ramlibacter aurantiacus]
MSVKQIQQASNHLYYGDNLEVLRESIPSESVDLVYLDPPFNSKATYNILFRTPSGAQSQAQIEAFEDTWHWNESAEQAFDDVLQSGNTSVAEMLSALRQYLKENDMMAYLTMMTVRLLELRRILKKTGSLFLHCDPTASHYLKIILDGIFGVENFRSEIIWRRTGSHHTKRKFGPIHDVILFYTRSNDYYFKVVKRPYMRKHVEKRYTLDVGSGKMQFTSGGNVLTGEGIRKGESGMPWRNVDPTAKGRHWAIPGFLAEQMDDEEFESFGVLAKLEALYQVGLIEFTEGNAWPVPVRYLKPDDGQALQDIWAAQPYTEGTVFGSSDIVDADVAWLGTTDPERLGYPTQKPVGLLERIVEAACPEGGSVLDPFCGCGTTIHAAQKLKRPWTGIDVTHLSISLIEKRLKDAFPGISFDVHGTPKDIAGAAALALADKYQFQWWACSLVNAQPYQGKKKGADGGIDGIIYFKDEAKGHKKIIVSVKGGENVNVAMIRDLAHVVVREKADIGLFLTLSSPTKPMSVEAVKAGYYTSPATGHKFPKLQILSIDGLLSGTEKALYPDLSQGATTFKKAQVEESPVIQPKLF